ncbi:hypothetical protein CIB93_18245 [Streptomyces sp. WZ.A104]|nr:hypothetical protein CIB93_18245 [Streptomyces sp. WZ.A104]
MPLAAWLSVAGLIALLVGLVLVLNARRMHGRLSAAPWTACVARSTISAMTGAPRLVLRDPRTGDLVCLGAVVAQANARLAETGWDGILWWCGDPVRGGVASRPGGEGLFWARPETGAKGSRLIEWARETGIDGRPDPERIPGQRPQAGPGTAEHRAPAAVPRRRPCWRWVLLVGCAVLGLGIAASLAAMDDPKAELTVISESADGDCTVRWADPWSGERREGPFRCDPDRAPILHDREVGWVVSYGPWKGDLYNADWEGTPANEVNDVVFLAGVLLILGSLIGGAIRVVRRMRDRRSFAHRPAHASLVTPPRPRVSLVKGAPAEQGPDLSCAVMSAAAERRAPHVTEPLPPLPPGALERPWWRIGPLLELSATLGTLRSLAVSLAATALWLWLDEPAPLLVGGLAACNAVRLGYRALRHGIPNVRGLVRATRHPGPVRKRYALLRSHDDTMVLIFFPLDGGPEAQAESSLEVFPPGTSRKPWRGLPAPTGVAELYGDADGTPTTDGGRTGALPDDAERPLLVPWIDGRPLWPLHGYDAVRPEDVRDREYFAGLLS